MTAHTLADRLRNHVAPSRADMAAYADEVEALGALVTEAQRQGRGAVEWYRRKAEEDTNLHAASQRLLADDLTLARLACDDKEEFIADVRAKLAHTEAERDDALRRLATLPDPEQAVREAQAKAWDEGMRTGSSRAMRHMSDEPNLPLASDADNPYREARP